MATSKPKQLGTKQAAAAEELLDDLRAAKERQAEANAEVRQIRRLLTDYRALADGALKQRIGSALATHKRGQPKSSGSQGKKP
jgi:hypothetical protein